MHIYCPYLEGILSLPLNIPTSCVSTPETLEAPHFTCASALTQQLPILEGLVPTSHPCNNHQLLIPNCSHSPPPVSSSTLSFILSSDSDSDDHTYIPSKSPLPPPLHMSTLATVEPMSGKAPVLTASDLTPAVAMDFENTAQDFFVTKSVPADKQVSLILPGIKDICMCDWIMADQACITSLTFTNFIKEPHENYLQNDWEDQIWNNILTSTLASSKKSFWNWSQQLLSLNCLLHNTPSVFNDVALRNHLKAHLDNELKEKLKHSKAQNDKVFKTWVATVCLLDEARTTKNKHQLDLIEGALQCQAKCQATDTNALCGPSHCNNTTSSSSTSSSTSNCLAPLAEGERSLLNEHDGCTKCRHFYIGHHSHNCTLGIPTAKGYCMLTISNALAAKKTKATVKTNTKAVSTTITAVDSSNDKASTVAAVLPNSPGGYSSDSVEDADISHHDVSSPLHVKHLFWNCQIHRLIDDFPVKTQVLMENGTHLVLICPDLAAQLGLKVFTSMSLKSSMLP